MRTWVYSPHSGGKKAPPAVQERIRDSILKHAAKNYAGKYDRIDVRFRGALCYVDAYVESSPHPTHLVRLRYKGDENSMTVALYFTRTATRNTNRPFSTTVQTMGRRRRLLTSEPCI